MHKDWYVFYTRSLGMEEVYLQGEGFSEGEDTALPTTLSGLGSADGSCPRSLLDLRGWGVLWGRGFEEAILVQVECENDVPVSAAR